MTATDRLILTAAVKGGKLDLNEFQRKRIPDFLAALEGKRVTVRMERERNTRSLRQNKFYWGVTLTTLADATGYTTEELHEVLKRKFLPRSFVTLGGETVEVEKSTTRLTTTEFAKYLEQVAAFAAELGITLPEAP